MNHMRAFETKAFILFVAIYSRSKAHSGLQLNISHARTTYTLKKGLFGVCVSDVHPPAAAGCSIYTNNISKRGALLYCCVCVRC